MTAKEHLRSLGFIHIFLLIVTAGAIGAAYYLNRNMTDNQIIISSENQTAILLVACIIFGIIGVIVGDILYKARVQKINDDANQDYAHKLSRFKGAVVLEWIWLILPALLAAASFYLTGPKQFFFIIVALVLWLVLLSNMPTRKKLVKDVDFTAEEKTQIFEKGEEETAS